MEGVLIDTFRDILTHLEARDLCQCASVNKIWCYEVSKTSLWRDLLLNNYKPESISSAFPRKPGLSEEERQFDEVLRSPSISIINNDWKRAYICKIKYKSPHMRIKCLSECIPTTFPHMPLLDPHHLGQFAHQPLMFEQFATKIAARTNPPSALYQRAQFDGKATPGLFSRILHQLGDDIHRAWMVVDTSRAEDLAERLSKEPDAIYCSLMGSFFNLINVHNFPYLVKVDSCLSFCSYVYDTSGGQWCYLMVEHPSLQSHIDSVWYLNIDKNLYPTKEIKTMAFLRRHFMKLYTWFKDFCMFSKPHTVIMMLHTFDQAARNEFFYEISGTNNEISSSILAHVVDYYILADNECKFFTDTMTIIKPDFEPKRANFNGTKGDIGKLTEYVVLHFLWRSEHTLKKYFSYIPDLAPEADLIPQLKLLKELGNSQGFVSERDLVSYFSWHYRDPKYAEHPLIKEVLENKAKQSNEARIRIIDDVLTQLEDAADNQEVDQKAE